MVQNKGGEQFGLTPEEAVDFQRLGRTALDRGSVEDGERFIALHHKQISAAVRAKVELQTMMALGESECIAQGGEERLRYLQEHQGEIEELAALASRPDYDSQDPYEVRFSGGMDVIHFRQTLAINKLRDDSGANYVSSNTIRELLNRFEHYDTLLQALGYVINLRRRFGGGSDDADLKRMADYLRARRA